MANNMVGDLAPLAFTNKQYSATLSGHTSHTGVGTTSNFVDINSMRTALTAANAAYYTTALLDKMTVNDMIFALRHANGGLTSTGSI
jgi:hypothetical protein